MRIVSVCTHEPCSTSSERSILAAHTTLAILEICDPQEERDGVEVAQQEQVGSYLELQQQLAAAKAAMRAVVNQPRHILPFLQPGRLVNIASDASGEHLS